MDAIFLNQYMLEQPEVITSWIHDYLSTPTVLSDHNILDITLKHSAMRITTNHFEENKAQLSEFNYSNADWGKVNQALSEINCNNLFQGKEEYS